jgi:predicted Zn-dependent protease
MQRAHKIELDPTVKQIQYFTRACGVSRFTWNWGLAAWGKLYRVGGKTSGLGIRVLVEGALGLASSTTLNPGILKESLEYAVKMAKATRGCIEKVTLAPVKPLRVSAESPWEKSPSDLADEEFISYSDHFDEAVHPVHPFLENHQSRYSFLRFFRFSTSSDSGDCRSFSFISMSS